MKIGQLKKQFNISEQAIRHYIKLGLLIPQHQGYQYIFNDQDIQDLIFIIECKQLDFSLKEILSIMPLFRTSKMTKSKETDQIIKIFMEKRKSLMTKIEEITAVISKIDDISDSMHVPMKRVKGIHFSCLDLLACPNCHSNLSLTDGSFYGNEVITGNLSCSCGIAYQIRNGIIYDEQYSTPESNPFYDKDATLFDDYNPKELSRLEGDERNLLYEILQGEKGHASAHRVFYEGNIRRWFFLQKRLELFDPSNIFIFADPYGSAVEGFKENFDQRQVSQRCIFMACVPERQPLKRKCIDVWVDYIDTMDYTEVGSEFLPEIIHPLLKQNAMVYGIIVLFRNSKYQDDLKQVYTGYSVAEFLNKNSFLKRLESAEYNYKKFVVLRQMNETSQRYGVRLEKPYPERILYTAIRK